MTVRFPWCLSVLLLPSPVWAQSAGLVYEQAAADGLVVMEAENCATNTAQGANAWEFVVAPGGFVGSGAMQALPDGAAGGAIDTAYETTSPRLDFKVAFQATGIHYVFVRGVSKPAPDSGSSDSCHVGLNGAVTPTADRLNSFDPVYNWNGYTMDADFCTIDVPSVGVHTVNLWMREDGFTVDRILVSTTREYLLEGDSAPGPPESNEIPDPSPEAPTGLVATPDPGGATLTWTAVAGAVSYTLMRGNVSGGPYTTVASGIAGTAFSDVGIAPPATYYYVVTAVNAFGSSPPSREASVVPLEPPPRPDGEDDGMWDGSCGCSAIPGGVPLGSGLLSLLALLLVVCRRSSP